MQWMAGLVGNLLFASKVSRTHHRVDQVEAEQCWVYGRCGMGKHSKTRSTGVPLNFLEVHGDFEKFHLGRQNRQKGLSQ